MLSLLLICLQRPKSLIADARAVADFSKQLIASSSVSMELLADRCGVSERIHLYLQKSPRAYRIVSDVEETWANGNRSWSYWPLARSWTRWRTSDGKDSFLITERMLPFDEYVLSKAPLNVPVPFSGTFKGKRAALGTVGETYGDIHTVIAVDPATHHLLGWKETQNGIVRTVVVRSLRFNRREPAHSLAFRPPKRSQEGDGGLLMFLPVGSLMPDIALSNQSGNVTKLSRIAGKGGTVVTFGSAGCGPCMAELRFLRGMQSALAQRGIAIAAIDTIDDAAKVRGLAAKEKFSWPFLLSKEETKIRTMYKSVGAPTCYILDGSRHIVSASQGFEEKELRAGLRRLGFVHS